MMYQISNEDVAEINDSRTSDMSFFEKYKVLK